MLTAAAFLPANAFAAAGALISAKPMEGAPDGSAAYRILYTSTDENGAEVMVSGVVIIPTAAPIPPGGRRIVAWAHPTTGVVEKCAPSLAHVFFDSVQGLKELLDQGYIVTATDYPGLGTPEVHPYLVGASEGHAVLDSVRAARRLPGAEASLDYAVWGHSQGGHAALFSGLLAKSYAPELHLAGIAVAAPATELATLMQDDQGTGGGNNITAMTLWSWSRVYDASLDPVVLPEARPVIDKLADLCIERWFDMLTRRGPTKELEKGFLSVSDLSQVEPWKRLLRENTPGPLPADIPVFVVQGSKDGLVRPQVTAAYAQSLCQRGSAVKFKMYDGVTHAFIARDAAHNAVEWMAKRFANEAPPSDCGKF
ncbi:alpha/beta fold hydrolase [Aestuariivirga sp.]|uniref:alpha/beta fold hydrolase n=1 Tax=Aestuariivirga sp. TaxID=2650926 RepID=UPI0039E39B6B